MTPSTTLRQAFIVACCVASASAALGQEMTATIVPTNYNGYHVSCFGMKDGSATVNVTGGIAPYTYGWSTGGNTATVTDLAAGYVKVKVSDSNGNVAEAEFTLNEPDPMKLVLTPFKYPSGTNISCYECFNGSIDLEVFGGVSPYSYSWGDDINTQDRSGLGAVHYDVVATDANGCYEKGSVKLEQPEKATWGMGGNANTYPATHYIGTSDNTDVVFKANGQESFRLRANGEISLLAPSAPAGLLVRGADGTLGVVDHDLPPFPSIPCFTFSTYPYWRSSGNAFPYLCPDDEPRLGTLSNTPLRIVTNGQERILVSREGNVGIGAEPTNSAEYRLFVEGGIVCRDVLVKHGAWPDFVFQPNYGLMPLAELRNYLQVNSHLPGIPSAAEVEEKGGVELGKMQTDLLQVVEEQALYILQLEERLGRVEQRLAGMEASQH